MTDGPDGAKSNYIQKIVRGFRRAARGQMIKNNASLRNRILAKEEKTRSKLINTIPDPTPGPPVLPTQPGEKAQSNRSVIDQLGGK